MRDNTPLQRWVHWIGRYLDMVGGDVLLLLLRSHTRHRSIALDVELKTNFLDLVEKINKPPDESHCACVGVQWRVGSVCVAVLLYLAVYNLPGLRMGGASVDSSLFHGGNCCFPLLCF